MLGTAAIRAGLCVLALLFAMARLVRAGDAPRVLMFFSDDRLLPANQRLDEGLRQAIDPDENQTGVTIFTEFLDVPRLAGEQNEQVMEEHLLRRYRNTPPAVLVVLGKEALDFWLARRDRLFPGTPVVFGGGSGRTSIAGRGIRHHRPADGNDGGTGGRVAAGHAPSNAADLLVHGSADYDRAWREIALRQCKPFTDRVEVVDFPELPLEELKARLAKLPVDAAVIYLTYFQSPTGQTYTPARVAKEIAAASSVRVVGPYDTYIGTGVLGVACSLFEAEGVAIGKLTRRVLAGESPESIGILPPTPARLVVDEREVKRWGIQSLPAGTDARRDRCLQCRQRVVHARGLRSGDRSV